MNLREASARFRGDLRAEARSGNTEECRNEVTVGDVPKARAPGMDIARPAAAPRITVRMPEKGRIMRPCMCKKKKELWRDFTLDVQSAYRGHARSGG